MNVAARLFNDPSPVRSVCRVAIRRLGIGSYPFRLSIGAVVRPNYAFLVYQAAQLAARLGQPRVSVLEFGVAGGAGLLALEYHAERVEKLFPVKIDIYGFDTGRGLPEAVDYRDLQYHWKPRFYEMNVPSLKARLKRAELILGDVRETVGRFFKEHNPPPIGAISLDLDFHSSTVMALRLLDADPHHFLPRAICYFDDTIGSHTELYGDFTGVRLAINDFNGCHEKTKLTPLYYLRATPVAPEWHHKMWSLHLFDHNDYNTFISDDDQQLPLAAPPSRHPKLGVARRPTKPAIG
jgi:hypothetical protein